MYTGRISLIILLLSFNYPYNHAQQIARQKCRQQVNISNTPGRVGISVVGGSLAQSNEFPYMAALGYGPQQDLKWLCGGTIISENYILTAAHCTTNKQFGSVQVARVGVRNIKNIGGQDIEVEEIITHPNYKGPSQYHDIALLKLKSVITFSSSALPVCINTEFDIRPRNKLTATGWGLVDFLGDPSEDLLKVDLFLYPYGQCRRQYSSVPRRKLPNGIDNFTQICAGGIRDEEKDTCQGDSGGPLIMKAGRKDMLAGVTSFGKGCGIANTPGVYTRVSSYVPWIESIVWG